MNAPALRFRVGEEAPHTEARRHGGERGLNLRNSVAPCEKTAVATVPEVRFKGFAGVWEKKSLGELFDERQRRSVYGELLSVTMNAGVILARDNGRYDNSSVGNGNYKEVRKGDIAYNSMRMWQGACGASIFDGLVSPAYTVVVPKDDADGIFFEYAFKLPKMLHAFRKHSQGLTSDTWNLKFPLFSQVNVHYPSLLEQRKIGSFFRSLDALIEARANALGKVESLKKSMLQKMFPQGESLVPEVRFREFDGEWTVKLLGEIAEFNPKCDLPDVFEYVDLESVVGTAIISHRTENRHSAPSRAQRLAKPGDVFFQTVRPYQKNNCLYSQDGKVPFVFSTGYAQLRPHVDGQFLLSALQCDVFVNRVLDECTGTSYPAINDTRLEGIAMAVPRALSEQQKIGAYFRSFDALIAARREEIGKLKQMKKALLERMFV